MGCGRRLLRLFPAFLALLASVPLAGCRSVPWKLASASLGLPDPAYDVSVRRNVMVPMKDGVRLATDLYRPRTAEPVPALLIRTPYDKRSLLYGYEIIGGLFAAHGYAVAIQDVRGKYRSEGRFYPIVNEGPDGAQAVRWLSAQPWCDGRIGMFGVSYYGSTEWLAAPEAPDNLLAIVPVFTSQDGYRVWLNRGVYNFHLTLLWHFQYDTRRKRAVNLLEWHRALRSLPLIDADDRLGAPNPIYDEWISHPLPGPFWEPMSVARRVPQIRCPALLVAGWFDPFLNAMLEDYQRIRKEGGSAAARQSQLIVGPWTHTTESRFQAADFGQEAHFLGQIDTIFRWYDHWLRGRENGIDEEGPIRIFVMGRNEWRTEREWPPARARYVDYFLHSEGRANTAGGDGVLSIQPPAEEPPDRFDYDPVRPVPSGEGPLGVGDFSAEPRLQSRVEEREDVLVYTTGRLSEELEITGPITLTLYAASSAVDTDFTARLTDVRPDGRSVYVTSGIVRARFRDSLGSPSPLEAGSVYRYEIQLGSTSIALAPGHSLRLQVSSSDFPHHDRNLNTGAPIGLSSQARVARQTVYHDAGRPSRLLLPVVPPPGSP